MSWIADTATASDWSQQHTDYAGTYFHDRRPESAFRWLRNSVNALARNASSRNPRTRGPARSHRDV